MSRPALFLVGLGVGSLIALQVGINARLRQSLGSSLQAAFVSFAVGTAALAIAVAVDSRKLPTEGFLRIPWWAWTGGFLGAFYITSTIVLAPRLGALALVALVVAGQILTAIVLDHFGLFAFSRQPVTASRLVGAALLMAGVLLVLRRDH